MVQAYELMEHWPGVDPQRTGILAFSVGDLLAFLGGYADATSLLDTMGRRAQVVNGKAQPWKPISTDLYVLARTVSSLFTPTDQQLMQQAFPLTTIAPPLNTQQLAQLSPDAAAYYHLLEGDEPGSVDGNLAALSPAVKALLTQLSPLSVLGQIRAPIHLLHDRNDPSIPFTQAQQFAAALARLHHPYDFAAYSIFSHIQVQSNLSLGQLLGDGSRLLWVLTSILLVGS